MIYNPLYFLVEGNDDERFFKGLEKKGIFKDYAPIIYWKYSKRKNEKIVGFIRSIDSMGDTYIFVTDLDNNNSIESKIEEKCQEFNSLDPHNVVVVKKMIESWYLAGIDNKCLMLRKIKVPKSTNKIDKNCFLNKMPICFGTSRIDFMNEILKYFNFELAQERNSSFKQFLRKF